MKQDRLYRTKTTPKIFTLPSRRLEELQRLITRLTVVQYSKGGCELHARTYEYLPMDCTTFLRDELQHQIPYQ